MRVLVTGSRGFVGTRVTRDLQAADHQVVGFDLVDGQDILDLHGLRRAASGCDGIVHAAAFPGLDGQREAETIEVNSVGTENVLLVAAEVGVTRVVNISSVDVLGVFKGERSPDYLPLDDSHPCYPQTAYGRSKLDGEEACRRIQEVADLSVISLRPPGVWNVATYAYIEAERAKRPEFEWDPYWEYGAFIDVRDLSSACLRGLTCDATGSHSFLVAASDITTSGRTSRELASLVHPDVEWRGGAEYDKEPYRSLIDSGPARTLLKWAPVYTWSARPRHGT